MTKSFSLIVSPKRINFIYYGRTHFHSPRIIGALSQAYFFLKSDTSQNDVNQCATHLQQTIGEYQQRELKLIELGIVKDVA